MVRSRKVLAFLTGVMLATAALLVVAVPAQAAITTYISVLNPPGQSGKKVMDVYKLSLENRAPVQLWDLRSTGEFRNQRWTITHLGNDVYEIKNQLSGKCLDKSVDHQPANGAQVYQYDCSRSSQQLWWFQRVVPESNWGILKNLVDFRCLEAPRGVGFANGNRLTVMDCNYEWYQRFNIF